MVALFGELSMSTRALKFLHICLGCLILGGVGFSQNGFSDPIQASQRYYFDIPELPLHQSILEFAFQADCEVLAQEKDLTRQQGRRVRGYLSPLQALENLLAGAGLTAEFLSEAQAYVIRVAPTQMAESGSERKIEEVLVTAKRYPARYQTVVSSEDRYGGAVFDPTRAHNILPEAVLADSASESLMDALRYISSATPGDGLADSNDGYFLRGFPAQNTYIDGLRVSNTTAIQIVPDAIERLDVLKGPSMLFYGQSSAGGVVDVTRKKAAAEDWLRAEFAFGEPTRHKFFIAANKAELLGNLDVLLMGMDERQQENSDSRHRHRQLFNIRGQGHVQDRLIYGVGYEYQYLNKATAQHLPIFTDSSQFLSYLGRDFINQAEDEFSASAELVDSTFNFTLMPEWQLQGNFLWQSEIRNGVRISENFLTDAHVLLPPNPTHTRVGMAAVMGQMAAPILRVGSHYTFGPLENLYDQHEADKAHTASLAINGQLQTGAIEHRLIAGVDVYRQWLHQQFAVEERLFLSEPVFSESILKNPQKFLFNTLLQEMPLTSSIKLKEWRINREDWGSYFQFRSNWSAKWNMSLGWRYSRFYEKRREIEGSNPDLEGTYSDWLMQAGSSWQLGDTMSLYGNYSETLNLNYLIDDFERFVEQPEKSTQYELGLKWQARGGQALGTISLFNIASSGVNTVKFESGYRTLKMPQKREVQGIEIDLTWKINARTEWIASAALMRNDFKEEHSATLYPRMVADNTFGLFGRINLSDTWTSYAGLNYVSDRSVDGGGEAKLDAYTLIDLALEKMLVSGAHEWKIRAMVKNLLDEYHLSVALPGIRATPAPGRHAMIELTYLLQE
jgi:Outer membrane receptor proteins, mostly Fe transport